MSKLKNILLGVLATCLVASAGAGLAACASKDSSFPDYKIPEGGLPPYNGDSNVFEGVYRIKTRSKGGLSLNGVRVSAVKDGRVVKSGISIDGVIELTLDSDEYELVVDSDPQYMPEGYFVPDGTVFKTEKDNPDASVYLSSAVIDSPATAGTAYQKGSVMHDFTFTYVDGTKENGNSVRKSASLKKTLEEKKCVVLNFWYRGCGPCRREMPHMQNIYQKFKDDAALFALSTSDSMNEIDAFQQEYGYTFSMGPDVGQYAFFGYNTAPVTVVIDRYGIVAEVISGSLEKESDWNAIFGKYTSDDYEQNINGDDDGDDTNPPDELVPPDKDLVIPSEEQVLSIIGGRGTKGKLNYFAKDEESTSEPWPFIIEHDDMQNIDVLSASNATKGNSFSYMYVTLDLNYGDIVSFDYYMNSTEKTDICYVIKRGATRAEDETLKMYSMTSGGWQTEHAFYIAARQEQISIAFSYLKNNTPTGGEDFFWLRNITIENIDTVTEATDMIHDAAYNDPAKALVNGKYNTYTPVGVNKEDGYYHILDEKGQPNGALLLFDMLNVTPWTSLHCAGNTFELPNDATPKKSSLYNYAYWYMTNWRASSDESKNEKLKFTFNNKDVTAFFIEHYYMQEFSDNLYLPVTEELKEVIDDFLKEFHCQKYSFGGNFYEDEWLELCFYYEHYGNKHTEKNEDGQIVEIDLCPNSFEVPIKGLSTRTALIAEEGVPNPVNITKIYNYNGGGLYYSFTAKKAGLYHVYSSYGLDTSANPDLTIMNTNGKVLADFSDDNRHDAFSRKDYENFYGWIYLEKGQQIYLQCRMYAPGDLGSYLLNIELLEQEEIEVLTFCGESTMFVSGLDENGNLDPSKTKYMAIEAGLNPQDNVWYSIDENYGFGSKIYIDFLNPNFYTINGSSSSLKLLSLSDMINNGVFDFTKYGGKNMTNRMKKYYLDSLKNQGELYGLCEADTQIVDILNSYLEIAGWADTGTGEPNTSWLAFACYYVRYGK